MKNNTGERFANGEKLLKKNFIELLQTAETHRDWQKISDMSERVARSLYETETYEKNKSAFAGFAKNDDEDSVRKVLGLGPTYYVKSVLLVEQSKPELISRIRTADSKDEWKEIAEECVKNLEEFELIENSYKNPKFTGGIIATVRLMYGLEIMRAETYEELIDALNNAQKSIEDIMEDAHRFQLGCEDDLG